MPTTAEILKTIAEHLTLNPEDVDRGASLRDELGLGPIELNDLLTNLSEKFDVVLRPDEVEKLETVEDLIVLIEDNLIG